VVFLLAPILLVILHVYVLLQVLLLGRTTTAYNDAVAGLGFSTEESASLRQRLANTLFAQRFAGSPREREGFIGVLLSIIIWTTLVAAPIRIILAFQLRFLPYHSHVCYLDASISNFGRIGSVFFIWPMALDAHRDFNLPQVRRSLKGLAMLPWRLIARSNQRSEKWLWISRLATPERQKVSTRADPSGFLDIPAGLLLAKTCGRPRRTRSEIHS
jgi:hypothetical protein